jgi:transposase
MVFPGTTEKSSFLPFNDEVAENVAIIYSVLGCCKAHGVNFREWMIYFLNNVHNYDNDYSKDLAELLPHKFNKIQAGSV